MPLLPLGSGLDSWSLSISQGVTGVYRRHWSWEDAGLPCSQSQTSAFLCPCWEPNLSSLTPSFCLSCFFPLPILLSLNSFSHSLFSSPIELRARGQGLFFFLAVHNFRKPCCFCQQWSRCSEGGDWGRVQGMSQEEWETDVEILCGWASSEEF